MFKISDILKKAKKQEKLSAKPLLENKTQPGTVFGTTQPKFQPQKSDSFEQKKEEKEESPPEQKAKEQGIVLEEQEVISLYKKAVNLIEQVMSPFVVEGPSLIKEIRLVIEKFIELLRRNDSPLFNIFFQDYPVSKTYIYQHSVNVGLLCLRMGIVLNYDYDHLKKMGMGAILHDIGLVEVNELIMQPRRLNNEEYNEVKRHPLIGQDVLKKFAQDLEFETFDVIRQEHERLDGSGYPYSLTQDDICEFAKLVGLVDVYEAMIHSRPYRAKLGCLKAIQQILTNRKAFKQQLVKILIDNIGVFPVGTLIEMNTREIGMVIKQNPKMPLRPVVDITYSASKEKLEQPKRIDLSKNFAIYVKDCFNEELS